MAEKDWIHIYTAYGRLDAAMMVDFLSANGIEATSMQESLGSVYGLTVGPLGEAKIYVPVKDKDAALDLIRQMEEGKLELPENNSSFPADEKD